MKHLLALGILIGLGTFGTAALADDAENARHVERAFARLDTNHDGKISREEGSRGRRIARHFDAIDADHDGFITPAELKAFLDAHPIHKHHR
jgi:Ca2+-binding EF-hand superfamily protein